MSAIVAALIVYVALGGVIVAGLAWITRPRRPSARAVARQRRRRATHVLAPGRPPRWRRAR